MKEFHIEPSEIGKRIRMLRQKQHKTQAYYADMLFISPSYLALIESGKRIPTLEVLAQISKVADVTLDYLIWGNKSELDSETRTFERLRNEYTPQQIRQALQLMEFFLKLTEKTDVVDE